jgi:hypothetical protein
MVQTPFFVIPHVNEKLTQTPLLYHRCIVWVHWINMNNCSKNNQICPFINGKSPSMVMQVFRCCTHDIVLSQTLYTKLYSLLRDSSPFPLSSCSLFRVVTCNCRHKENTNIKRLHRVLGHHQLPQ